MRTFLKKIFPWLIAAGILVWLFRQYPPGQVFKAVALINPVVFSLLAVSYLIAILVIDCWGTAWNARALLHPIPWRSLLIPRAATYLLAMINYGAGQAALALAVRRSSRIALRDALGLFFLLTCGDLFWIITLAFAGSFIGEHRVLGVDLVPMIQSFGLATYAAIAAHLVYWRLIAPRVSTTNRWTHWLHRLHQLPVVHLFERMRGRDYVRLVASRLPMHVCAIAGMYALCVIFRAGIPLTIVLGNVPIAFLVGAIPISWGGIGTSNKTLIDLMSPAVDSPLLAAHGLTPAELLFAMSLLWMLTNYLLKAALGLWALPRLTRHSTDIPHTVAAEKHIHSRSSRGDELQQLQAGG